MEKMAFTATARNADEGPAYGPADTASARIAEARRRGDSISVVETETATAILIARPAQPRSAVFLKLAEGAARFGTTERVLKDAIRAGELPAFGRERDRTVRLGDLEQWNESRRVVHTEIDDDDLKKRMKRLREQRSTAGKRGA